MTLIKSFRSKLINNKKNGKNLHFLSFFIIGLISITSLGFSSTTYAATLKEITATVTYPAADANGHSAGELFSSSKDINDNYIPTKAQISIMGSNINGAGNTTCIEDLNSGNGLIIINGNFYYVLGQNPSSCNLDNMLDGENYIITVYADTSGDSSIQTNGIDFKNQQNYQHKIYYTKSEADTTFVAKTDVLDGSGVVRTDVLPYKKGQVIGSGGIRENCSGVSCDSNYYDVTNLQPKNVKLGIQFGNQAVGTLVEGISETLLSGIIIDNICSDTPGVYCYQNDFNNDGYNDLIMYNSPGHIFYIRQFEPLLRRFSLKSTIDTLCVNSMPGNWEQTCTIDPASIKIFKKGQLGTAFPVIHYIKTTRRSRTNKSSYAYSFNFISNLGITNQNEFDPIFSIGSGWGSNILGITYSKNGNYALFGGSGVAYRNYARYTKEIFLRFYGNNQVQIITNPSNATTIYSSNNLSVLNDNEFIISHGNGGNVIDKISLSDTGNSTITTLYNNSLNTNEFFKSIEIPYIMPLTTDSIQIGFRKSTPVANSPNQINMSDNTNGIILNKNTGVIFSNISYIPSGYYANRPNLYNNETFVNIPDKKIALISSGRKMYIIDYLNLNNITKTYYGYGGISANVCSGYWLGNRDGYVFETNSKIVGNNLFFFSLNTQVMSSIGNSCLGRVHHIPADNSSIGFNNFDLVNRTLTTPTTMRGTTNPYMGQRGTANGQRGIFFNNIAYEYFDENGDGRNNTNKGINYLKVLSLLNGGTTILNIYTANNGFGSLLQKTTNGNIFYIESGVNAYVVDTINATVYSGLKSDFNIKNNFITYSSSTAKFLLVDNGTTITKTDYINLIFLKDYTYYENGQILRIASNGSVQLISVNPINKNITFDNTQIFTSRFSPGASTPIKNTILLNADLFNNNISFLYFDTRRSSANYTMKYTFKNTTFLASIFSFEGDTYVLNLQDTTPLYYQAYSGNTRSLARTYSYKFLRINNSFGELLGTRINTNFGRRPTYQWNQGGIQIDTTKL